MRPPKNRRHIFPLPSVAILAWLSVGLGCDRTQRDVGSYAVDAGNAGGGEVDAGIAGGGEDAGDASAAGGGDSQPNGDGGCGASADVRAVRKHTVVWLLIEASSLMADVHGVAFGGEGVSGWTTLREVLLGARGLIPTFESVVEFGIVFHTGHSESCPNLLTLQPALDNGDAIDDLYPYAQSVREGGEGGGVTYKALEYVDQHLEDGGQGDLVPPQVLIIAKTTGESLCIEDASPVPDRPEQLLRQNLERVVTTKEASAYVVRVPVNTDTTIEFEDELAQIGGTGRAYTPMNGAQLAADFGSILRESISCEITLNGRVTEGLECQGSVLVDGAAIPCDPSNGWRLKGPSTLELVGKACSDLRDRPTAQIRADFPCGVIVI